MDRVSLPVDPTDELIWAACDHADECKHCPQSFESEHYGTCVQGCRLLAMETYGRIIKAAPELAPVDEGPDIPSVF